MLSAQCHLFYFWVREIGVALINVTFAGEWVCREKFQALVYIIPSTSTTIHYAIDPEKLSANEFLFDGAQMAVKL